VEGGRQSLLDLDLTDTTQTTSCALVNTRKQQKGFACRGVLPSWSLIPYVAYTSKSHTRGGKEEGNESSN